ncbi:MAG: S8 family serine peptidase [Flavobacterium sp.]|nr:S8 family serine peptidase [Flavobacterium sp.]
MTKRFLMLALGLISMELSATAQVTTNSKVLTEKATELKLAEDVNYQKTMKLAKEKGWDLVLTDSKGAKAYLVGTFEDGSPKYYTVYNNTIAAATTRANQLWAGGASGLNLSGSSANMKNKLAIWDGGKVLSTHVELTGRITQVDGVTSLSDHATHVTGTMMASGVNPIAKGMAYGLQGILAYDYNNDGSEITAAAANLVLSNHSYGIISGWYYNTSPSGGGAARWEFRGRFGDTEDYKFGYYDAGAKEFDDIAYNAPYYLIVKSAGNNRSVNGPAVGAAYYRYDASGTMAAAGTRPANISYNDGYDILPMDANAKNILTVGAVNGITFGYSKPTDVIMSSFSSWGPTDDGRIKPDIVADGVNVISSIASGNSDYEAESGTSMSAPNTTGSLLLLQEYFSQLKSGTFMRSATLRGLAIHTAEEAGDAVGPDYRFGWGLLNVEKGAAVIKAAVPSNNAATSEHLLYENTLANGATFTKTVVASGKGQLSATICWTDVSGTVTPSASALNDRTIKLVNDLDLKITKGTSTYMPWILDPSFPQGNATRGNNIRDNVERVDIDSVVPGQTYTITVSHKGTLSSGSQAYSLLVSGVGGNAYCTSVPTSTAGTRIDSVGFSNIQNKTATGCTSYKDFTNITGDIQPNKATTLSVKVNSCDGTNANKMVKVFIDYNNNGVFTDAGELVATSGVLTNGSIYTTTITTPLTITKNNYAVMRVIAQETSTASDINPCGTGTYVNGETQDYRLRVVKGANDGEVTAVLAPSIGSKFNPSQLLSIMVSNKGTANISNISLSATVKTGNTTVATLSGNYPATILAGDNIIYTFQTPFATTGGTAYTFNVTANVPNDQDNTNNTLVTSITTTQKAATPTGKAIQCTPSSTSLSVTNPSNSNKYFWYDTPAATTPLANTNATSTSVVTSNNTYYLQTGVRATVGPLTNTALGSGSYGSTFSGTYTTDTAAIPLIIETAKIYCNVAGKVGIAFRPAFKNGTGYSYYPTLGDSITVDVFPNLDANGIDTGANYYLNLKLDNSIRSAYLMTINCLNGASIYRNNGVTSNPYPVGIPGVFQILTNAAATPASYYYFLYNIKIATLSDSLSDRAAIVATTPTPPTITLVGAVSDSLQTNAVSAIQWYLNGNTISGANTTRIKPIYSGSYSVSGSDANGCNATSAALIYTATTGVINVSNTEIGLSTTPNPNNGVFKVNFKVSNKDDLQIALLDISGKTVFIKSYANFVGTFSEQFTTSNIASGNYILKIQHGNKVYRSKLFIVK